MSKFIISGFADEIHESFDAQLEGLKKLGISYMEIRTVDGKNISVLEEEEVRQAKEKLDRAGIQVSAVGSPIGKIDITDDFEAHLELLKKVMKTAKILGTNYVRVFSFFVKHSELEQYREKVMEQMGRMAKAAEAEGIILLHENEKDIYGDMPERCLEIIQTINSPNLKVTFDPANFIQCGADVYPQAYELLAPYITYMHIKDAEADGSVVPAGYGVGGVKQILDRLKENGFEGFLSLEPHLGSFTGLSLLEKTDIMEKLPEGGFDKFEIAYKALQKLIG